MNLKGKRVLVFCSSAESIPEVYRRCAERLGFLIAREGCELVFGGTSAGLMKILAQAAARGGARVKGIIPEKMHLKGQSFNGCTEVLVSRDLHERKAMMHAASDIVICLPGGIGSLDEFAEAMALKQLRYHQKPLVLINVSGYFDLLLEFLKKMRTEGFAREESLGYFTAVSGADEALDFLGRYEAL